MPKNSGGSSDHAVRAAAGNLNDGSVTSDSESGKKLAADEDGEEEDGDGGGKGATKKNEAQKIRGHPAKFLSSHNKLHDENEDPIPPLRHVSVPITAKEINDDNTRSSLRSAASRQASVKSFHSAVDETDLDRLSQFSLYMVHDFRYYFQHPYLRIFIAYFVCFCNFLIYAEDPVAHSIKECKIPVVGNMFAFVCTRYPPNVWSVLKVAIWLMGMITGAFFGKFVMHKLVFNKLLRLKLFCDDQGSWMTMFMSIILFTFTFSYLYNAFLLIGGDEMIPYHISPLMGISNSWFMKAAACGTWLGDAFTAWMITDIMLQEKLYPNWAVPVRKWWKKGWNRIILFWFLVILLTVVVVTVITTDYISWDTLNRDLLPTNELSRAFLASFILVMDLLIVMQDWDFPHFINNFDIKLPGLNTAHIKFEIPKCLKKESWMVHISGKWFNYGIIFLVMLLDLNMWKNQIFYEPFEYGQYVNPHNKILTVKSHTQVEEHNETLISYAYRSTTFINGTNVTLMTEDIKMNTEYLGYVLGVKSIAFIPSLLAFIIFGLLINCFGRFKPNKMDVYAEPTPV
ncbi:transmembrane protein 117-like isoform X2 [Lineus longissimus]|uniref:transmembrane protein 117-like isoform X2 n=1 Tax=Lineus longissimus TaxID=88925 RepID=UPI002B4C3139